MNILLLMLTNNIMLIGDSARYSSEVIGRRAQDDITTLYTPAHVIVHHGTHGGVGFLLKPWVPHEFLENTCVSIASDSILAVLTPRSSLVKFYEVWVKAEREKMVLFGKEYTDQITDISVFYSEQHEQLKRAYSHSQQLTKNPLKVPDAVYDLFESDTEWGNPKITN